MSMQAEAGKPQPVNFPLDVPFVVEAAYTDGSGTRIPVETAYQLTPLPSAGDGGQAYVLHARTRARVKLPLTRYENTETGEVDEALFTFVRGSLTIRYAVAGFHQYRIKSVSGSWSTPISSAFPLKNKKVAVFGRNEEIIEYPTENSFKYATGFKNYTRPLDSFPHAASETDGGIGTAPGNWGKLRIMVYPA